MPEKSNSPSIDRQDTSLIAQMFGTKVQKVESMARYCYNQSSENTYLTYFYLVPEFLKIQSVQAKRGELQINGKLSIIYDNIF